MLTVSFVFQIKLPSTEGTKPNPSPLFITIIQDVFVLVAVLAFLFVVSLMIYHAWLLLWAKTTTKGHLTGKNISSVSIKDRLVGSDALFDLREVIDPSEFMHSP